MVGSGHNRKSMAYVGNVSALLVYALRVGSHIKSLEIQVFRSDRSADGMTGKRGESG